MSKTIINVQGLGKKYLIGHERKERYTAMRDVMVQGIKDFGKGFKRLFSEYGPGISGNEIEEFWALKDLSFEIKQGDAVGIIGRNGAGKSTLLKILSRITVPTKGHIEIIGRMASLLEVGTGFHPELTGRENIFLNGAIMGMNRNEIKRKFDEIVEFSGIEQFLDTPVKRFSSGMYVRLAFAVAAHLESEILVVDEVLAVGDAEFQKKCLGKMDDVAQKEGRTVLFVSHNMQAMSTLCNKGMLLNKGVMEYSGEISDCIANYYKGSTVFSLTAYTSLNDRLDRTTGKVRFDRVEIIKHKAADDAWNFNTEQHIEFKFDCLAFEESDGLLFYMAIKSQMSDLIISNFKTVVLGTKISKGQIISFNVSLPGNTLRPGQYNLYFAIADQFSKEWNDVIDENVSMPSLIIRSSKIDSHENTGFCTLPFQFKINEV